LNDIATALNNFEKTLYMY